MLPLVLAILCSVTVGVLIKYARQKDIIIEQSIAVNYIVTTMLTFLLLKPDFQGQSITEMVANNPSSYVFVILSMTLPAIFLVQAKK